MDEPGLRAFREIGLVDAVTGALMRRQPDLETEEAAELAEAALEEYIAFTDRMERGLDNLS